MLELLFSKKGLKVAVLTLGLLMFSAVSLNAASTSASLTTSDTSKSTAYLGNTTGSYKLIGAIGTLAKYQAEYIVYCGANSSSCTTVAYKKSLAIGSPAFLSTFKVDKAKYTVAKCTIYGNTKANTYKNCSASAQLSNV